MVQVRRSSVKMVKGVKVLTSQISVNIILAKMAFFLARNYSRNPCLFTFSVRYIWLFGQKKLEGNVNFSKVCLYMVSTSLPVTSRASFCSGVVIIESLKAICKYIFHLLCIICWSFVKMYNTNHI